MSTSAAHAAAFYREVAAGKSVWTVRDAGGFPAPQLSDGRRAQPFWSTRSRAERVIANVDAYREFELYEVPADVFLERWLPGLERDGILVGVNWTGANATGYDVGADEVRVNIASARERRKAHRCHLART
jgi:hypothetical protein